jgi:hypothetical protein
VEREKDAGVPPSKEPDLYDQLRAGMEVCSTSRPGNQDEFTAFTEASPIRITGSALAWWCQPA